LAADKFALARDHLSPRTLNIGNPSACRQAATLFARQVPRHPQMMPRLRIAVALGIGERAMPTFTDGSDTYTVKTAGTYVLDFLGGDDRLNVYGASTVTSHLGDGNDLAILKAGLSTIFGDAGADRFDIYASNAAIDGGADNDLINLRGGSGVMAHGGLGDDRFNFLADTSLVTLYGDDGADLFVGYNHNVSGSLNGGAGNDFFTQFKAGVTLIGGLGDDVYRLTIGPYPTIIENAGEGVDTVQLPRGCDYIMPDNLENVSVLQIPGSTLLEPTIVGNALDNRIAGHDNDETLIGQAGTDRLIGNGGSDTLFGGWGADTLTGGTGVDGFYYEEIGDSSLVLGYDIITDFEAGVDWIDLLEIDADGTKDGNQSFNPNGTSTHTPGDLWIGPYGAAGSANYMLYGDVNGDGQPDFQIRIHLASGSIDQINIVY
jgi:Ca2+-binding RTX toxin-like protein